MRTDRLQWLSKEQIEQRANAVLEFHSPGFQSDLQPKPTPLLAIVQKLAEEGRVLYDDSCPLGFAADASRILGCYLPENKEILIDVALKAYPNRFNFVLAHELGHFVLHRKLPSSAHKDLESEIFKEGSEQSGLTPGINRMEWQANYFASVLLLPERMLMLKLSYIRLRMGLPTNAKIRLDDQPCNQTDYYEIKRKLSEFFGVSKTVVEIRLNNMGLIDDRRGEGFDKAKVVNHVLNNMFSDLKRQEHKVAFDRLRSFNIEDYNGGDDSAPF